MGTTHARTTLSETSIRHKILADLEQIFQEALTTGNYPAALKAKELQGKELGLFRDKKEALPLSLSALSTPELQALIEDLQKDAPESRALPREVSTTLTKRPRTTRPKKAAQP